MKVVGPVRADAQPQDAHLIDHQQRSDEHQAGQRPPRFDPIPLGPSDERNVFGRGSHLLHLRPEPARGLSRSTHAGLNDNAKPMLTEVYRRLFDAFGPQHWWPGETPFEVIVGAVLTQNTSWQNVERAIRNLREADLLDPHALYAVPVEELEELIRPAGYFRVKAVRLRSVLEFIVERYDGSLDAMFSTGLPDLRRQLLEVHGIGPETADSILLYAGGLPSFVVDAYTHRIFARHGWIGFDADYHQIQDYVQGELPQEVPLYNEFHALLVRLGKDYCRKTNPKCAECPLREMLPKGGPLEPDVMRSSTKDTKEHEGMVYVVIRCQLKPRIA